MHALMNLIDVCRFMRFDVCAVGDSIIVFLIPKLNVSGNILRRF